MLKTRFSRVRIIRGVQRHISNYSYRVGVGKKPTLRTCLINMQSIGSKHLNTICQSRFHIYTCKYQSILHFTLLNCTIYHVNYFHTSGRFAPHDGAKRPHVWGKTSIVGILPPVVLRAVKHAYKKAQSRPSSKKIAKQLRCSVLTT